MSITATARFIHSTDTAEFEGEILSYEAGSCLTSDFCEGHYLVRPDGESHNLELCSHLITVRLPRSTYVAGWNTPGCLPESMPETFENLDEAVDYIAEELKRCAEEMPGDDEEMTDTEREIANAVIDSRAAQILVLQFGAFYLHVGGLDYFIEKTIVHQ